MAMEYDGRRVRVPRDLAARVDEARGQVPFNRWVVQAIGLALEQPRRGVTVPLKRGADPMGRTIEQQAADALAAAGPAAREVPLPDLPPFRCPTAGCTWRGARSPAATCSRHGRKVVPR